MPLLEGQKQWADLAQALASDAALTGGPDRAPLLARLGMLRLQRLKDVDGAIDAFDQALASDPAEKTARTTLEKLAGLGDHRLQAARVLEPLYRREGANAPLLQVLELRGATTADLDERVSKLPPYSQVAHL